jgi:hypothetical protein
MFCIGQFVTYLLTLPRTVTMRRYLEPFYTLPIEDGSVIRSRSTPVQMHSLEDPACRHEFIRKSWQAAWRYELLLLWLQVAGTVLTGWQWRGASSAGTVRLESVPSGRILLTAVPPLKVAGIIDWYSRVWDGMLELHWESASDRRSKTTQIILPWSEMKEVLLEFHRGTWGGYLSLNKNPNKVKQWYYWLHSKVNIEGWCHLHSKSPMSPEPQPGASA